MRGFERRGALAAGGDRGDRNHRRPRKTADGSRIVLASPSGTARHWVLQVRPQPADGVAVKQRSPISGSRVLLRET